MFSKYDALLRRYPLLTQSASAGLLFAIGDILAQSVSPSQKDDSVKSLWEPLRTLRMGFFGMAVAGPSIATWYVLLDRLQTSLLARVALDQLLFAPVFIGVFFTGTGLLEGSIDSKSYEFTMNMGTFP